VKDVAVLHVDRAGVVKQEEANGKALERTDFVCGIARRRRSFTGSAAGRAGARGGSGELV